MNFSILKITTKNIMKRPVTWTRIEEVLTYLETLSLSDRDVVIVDCADFSFFPKNTVEAVFMANRCSTLFHSNNKDIVAKKLHVRFFFDIVVSTLTASVVKYVSNGKIQSKIDQPLHVQTSSVKPHCPRGEQCCKYIECCMQIDPRKAAKYEKHCDDFEHIGTCTLSCCMKKSC